MFELEGLKQKSLAVKLGIPAVYGGADVNTQHPNSLIRFPAMPIDRNDVLRPLGGEDNLRLMCDARDFQYMDWGKGLQVTFSTSKFSIDVVHYPDRLDQSGRWSFTVWGKYRVHKIHRSDSVIDPDLFARTFEWATKYTLSF